MFDEIIKYKNNGHFFFKRGDKLSEVSKDVPDLPGVYYVIKLAKGKVELVYIGKSGNITQKKDMKKQTLRRRFDTPQGKLYSQEYLYEKIEDVNTDGLDIYWFVTMDKNNNDLPVYVEGLLLQRYFEENGELLLWNKELY
ncbi:MAG: hypothetical protein WAT71_08135 [Ignavibacteria bacterium]